MDLKIDQNKAANLYGGGRRLHARSSRKSALKVGEHEVPHCSPLRVPELMIENIEQSLLGLHVYFVTKVCALIVERSLLLEIYTILFPENKVKFREQKSGILSVSQKP